MPNEENKSGEQKAAEADVESFRKDLGPFVVAAETTRMAMVFTNAKEPDNPIIFANDSFLALTGHDREEVLGQSFNFLMARGADPEALAEIEAAFEGSSDRDPEIRYRRKDGSVFWVSIYISPVRDEGGDVVQHFASFVDLTKHKQQKDRLRFLLDELNHRTQNTLATVQAIAVQTLRGVADKEVVDAFEGRILALSKAHTLLGRENWDGVGLRDVIDQILQPFGLKDRHSRIGHCALDISEGRDRTAHHWPKRCGSRQGLCDSRKIMFSHALVMGRKNGCSCRVQGGHSRGTVR
jgi:PAS domain S-box-containing protein